MRQRDQSKRDPAVDEEDEDGELTTEALAARERRYERRWYSIDPEGSFRSKWDLAQAIILAYIALTVPFRVGLKQPAEGGWYVLDLIIDLYFYVDVVLNFVTGFEESEPDEAIDGSLDDAGRVVYDPAAIAKHYARTWLLIDVVACLPIDIAIRVSEDRFVCSMSSGGCPTAEIGEEDDSSGQLLRMFKMLRLFRLMKLLRLARIARLFERYQDDLFEYLHFFAVLKLIVVMLYVGHLFGCFFHYFSVDEWRTDDELAQIDAGTLSPWLKEYFDDADHASGDVWDRYIASMYWAFTTMTTVGYGDISSVTRSERVIACFGMLVGGFVFSGVIGTIGDVVAARDLSKKAHAQKMEAVAAFIRDNQLPQEYYKEVLGFFRKQHVVGYDRRALLNDMPYWLRKKIMFYTYKAVIEKTPLFDVDDGVDAHVFVTELCSRLRPVSYPSGQIIYQRGEIARHMFILTAGTVEVLDKTHAFALTTLAPGAYFGDEGKGKTVDAIARHPAVKVVARVNSGENAGHTVIGPTGVKYDFHLCPSGLLTPGKVNVVGPECVMDPVSFMEREISQLVKTDVAYKDRLFIGNVHLVCPHHKCLDLMGSWEAPNKSTLQGMGPVHASKASRRGLRLDHLFNEREGSHGARGRLERDMQTYWGTLKALDVSEAELLTKARVKLNLKNLYASNGFAVRELLKVATLLYDAHRNASGDTALALASCAETWRGEDRGVSSCVDWKSHHLCATGARRLHASASSEQHVRLTS